MKNVSLCSGVNLTVAWGIDIMILRLESDFVSVDLATEGFTPQHSFNKRNVFKNKRKVDRLVALYKGLHLRLLFSCFVVPYNTGRVFI